MARPVVPAGLMSVGSATATATTVALPSDPTIGDTSSKLDDSPTDATTTTTVPTTTLPTTTVPTTTVPTDTVPDGTASPVTTTATDHAGSAFDGARGTDDGGHPAGGGGWRRADRWSAAGSSVGAGGVVAGATGAGASSEPVGQMITGVAAVGTPISSGDVLYTADGQPVVALGGAFPAWRTMGTSSDDGADIAQLEAALVARSATTRTARSSSTPRGVPTATALVKRWQQGAGTDDTGEVTLGSLVFIPHGVPGVHLGGRGRRRVRWRRGAGLTGNEHRCHRNPPNSADVTPSMGVDVAVLRASSRGCAAPRAMAASLCRR